MAQASEKAHLKEENLLSQCTPHELLVQYLNIDWSHTPAYEIVTTPSGCWNTVEQSWGEYLLSETRTTGIKLWRPDGVVVQSFGQDVVVFSFLVHGDMLFIGDKYGVERVFYLSTGVLQTQWECSFAPNPVLHMKCGGKFLLVGSSHWLFVVAGKKGLNLPCCVCFHHQLAMTPH